MNDAFRHWSIVLGVTLAPLSVLTERATAEVPAEVSAFVAGYCTACHGGEKPKGEFGFDDLAWNLTDLESRRQWELVRDYVAEGDMPPESAKRRPPAGAVEAFVRRLNAEFARADRIAKPGGTPPRRLNRVEYLNTLRDLFGIRMVKLPASFPTDATKAEFDTTPAGMFLSPAVMEAYHDVATDVANRVVPLPGPRSYSSRMKAAEIGGDETRRWFGPNKEFLKFTGVNYSGWAGGLWDPLFVAPESGVYRVRLLANAGAGRGADGEPLRLVFHAFDPTSVHLPKRFVRSRAARVGAVDVPAGEPGWITCEIPVEAGETFHVYCENRFPANRFATVAADRSAVNRDVKTAKSKDAPTVELRELVVQGPVDVLPRVKEFFGTYPPSAKRAELGRILLPLAERAFRRPLTEAEGRRLLDAVEEHGRDVEHPEFAYHYAVRRILCSPQFLYREARPEGEGRLLDGYTLASRLSYTLWSTLPDEELLRLAAAGTLGRRDVLEAQIRRLLADPRSSRFVENFTGQWLGNREVAAVNVCDARHPWAEEVRYGYVRSSEMFFAEILRRNLPISTFVDSDFTYANTAMRSVWGVEGAPPLAIVERDRRQSLVWPEPTRLDLAEDGLPDHVRTRGGVLGLPGPLTITGDGVESSPVLRGVWVLENLLGRSPPPPPEDVPALDVDTSTASNVRETLALHQKSPSCAACHRDIDPLGLALENYDAVGGWRESYSDRAATRIDSSAAMPDGYRLDGPGAVKRYLLDRPELFTRCLLTKVLEYGAGRELGVGDRRVVESLVEAEPDDGYRFRDLIVAALTSEVFRAK